MAHEQNVTFPTMFGISAHPSGALERGLEKFENSQDDSLQQEAHVGLPGHSETPAEESSASEYFSCVSSPEKLSAVDEDGITQLPLDIVTFEHHEMTQPQVLEEWEASLLSTQDSFPLHLGTTHVKKIYHKHVQMKREVLQDHMEHTYREGFSCQVFHCVFSCLKRKKEEEEDEKEKEVDVEEEVEVEVESAHTPDKFSDKNSDSLLHFFSHLHNL
ncbi:hypothetical protein MUG91_G5n256 [Manis pentadactyla]|nr:hypothetical protein MUG91_G5n256 [Manis pentadactyla]